MDFGTLTRIYQDKKTNHLDGMASELEQHLKTVIEHPRIDRIICRVKSVDKFIEKAKKKKEDGTLKYSNPLLQIQDQIGARIIVFYKQDVQDIKYQIESFFNHIEELEKEAPGLEFGYESLHYILRYPKNEIPYAEASELDFFELQIKTLYQHAFAEAEHDMRYKYRGYLTKEQKRLFAFAAAQAWGADKVFEDLYQEIAENECLNLNS